LILGLTSYRGGNTYSVVIVEYLIGIFVGCIYLLIFTIYIIINAFSPSLIIDIYYASRKREVFKNGVNQ